MASEPVPPIFRYGDAEIAYLCGKDKRLARVIGEVGPIRRTCYDNLFEAVVNSIIGQQISTKAHQSIWRRITEDLGRLDARVVLTTGRERLQAYGTTWRKVDYIMDFARKVDEGTFDLGAVATLPDEAAIEALCSLKGIGVWTAEMILLFCLQRPDVLSYGDLAILRGIRMVYRHADVSRERFERYRRRFSPCCSVASLYLWAVAGGALPELTDPAAKTAKGARPPGASKIAPASGTAKTVEPPA